jgi:hypothetical protein
MQSSTTFFSVGIAGVLGSFAFPPAALPLLTVSTGAFLAGHASASYEARFVRPIKQRKHQVWLQTLDHEAEYQLGVSQAFVQNRIDWQARKSNQSQDLSGTLEERYFSLFTQGKQQPQVHHQPQQQVQPQSEPERVEQPAEPAQPEPESFDGAELPEGEDTWEPFNAGDVGIQEEDIAQLMAERSLTPDHCGTILIACPKGTGKSNLLRAAISYAHNLNSDIEFNVFNGKEDRDQTGQITSTYCGLERDSQRYINSGDHYRVDATFQRFQRITEALEKPFERPRINILEEYNNSLIAAETATKLQRLEEQMKPIKEREPVPDYADFIAVGTSLRTTKGRSKLIADWITSHSGLVQDIGLNTKLQHSVTNLVLARGDKTGAIEDALIGSRPLVKNPALRKQLYETFQQWENGSENRSRVVFLTNMGGRWRLGFLPHYPDNQPDLFGSDDAEIVHAEIVDD